MIKEEQNKTTTTIHTHVKARSSNEIEKNKNKTIHNNKTNERERERERLHFLVSVDASRQCMESRFVSLHFLVEMRLVQPAAVHIPSVDLSPATWIQQPL